MGIGALHLNVAIWINLRGTFVYPAHNGRTQFSLPRTLISFSLVLIQLFPLHVSNVFTGWWISILARHVKRRVLIIEICKLMPLFLQNGALLYFAAFNNDQLNLLLCRDINKTIASNHQYVTTFSKKTIQRQHNLKFKLFKSFSNDKQDFQIPYKRSRRWWRQEIIVWIEEAACGNWWESESRLRVSDGVLGGGWVLSPFVLMGLGVLSHRNIGQILSRHAGVRDGENKRKVCSCREGLREESYSCTKSIV